MVTAKQAAEYVRTQIASLKKSGEIAKKTKISVKVSGSGYTPTLEVVVTAFAGRIFSDASYFQEGYRYETPEAMVLLGHLREVAYEYKTDNSQAEFDHYEANFYVRVEFAPELKRAEEESFRARFAPVALDPNLSSGELVRFARAGFEKEVATNPVLPLLIWEDARFLTAMPSTFFKFAPETKAILAILP